MKIEGNYAFEAPLDTVWQGLFDPGVLARTLPGCEKLERQGDEFIGEINVKMGPVQGKFQGKVLISDVKDHESYTMVVDGRGPAGFAKATAHIRVKSEGAATRLDYDSDVQVGGRIASVGQRLLDASSRAIVKQSLEGLHQQLKALAALHVPAAPVLAAVAPAAALVPGALPAAPAIAIDGAAPVAASEPVAADAPVPVRAPVGASAAAAAGVPVAATAPLAPRAPSQAAFAMGVAKEVTKDLLATAHLGARLPVKVAWFVLAVIFLAWLYHVTG
jgi:carbon monoxide dehydrogenase subunit G